MTRDTRSPSWANAGLVTEADLLGQSLDEQGLADPNWDRLSRIAACKAGMQDGADVSVLRRIFGAEIVDQCTQGKSHAAVAKPEDTHSDKWPVLLKAIEDSTNSLKMELKDFDDALAMLLHEANPAAMPLSRRRKSFLQIMYKLQEWKQKQLRGTASLIDQDVENHFEKSIREIFDSVLRASDATASLFIQKLVSEAAQQLGHPLLQRPKLTWTGTVDSIARVQNAVASYRPDLIVAGNAGGLAITRLLTHNSELSGIPILAFEGHLSTQITWKTSLQEFGRPPIIAVVGDLALSGKTAAYVVRFLREHFGTPKVYCAVLAASSQALKETSADCRLIYHQFTAIGVPQLEFGPVTGLEIKGDRFVLISENFDIPIPFEGLRLARNDIKEQVGSEPTPWIKEAVSLVPK
jgi:hypothetical protein